MDMDILALLAGFQTGIVASIIVVLLLRVSIPRRGRESIWLWYHNLFSQLACIGRRDNHGGSPTTH